MAKVDYVVDSAVYDLQQVVEAYDNVERLKGNENKDLLSEWLSHW